MRLRFRHALPLLVVFGLLVGGGLVYARLSVEKPDARTASTADLKDTAPVVVTPAARRAFEECVEVQGTVEAKDFVTVSSRVPGIIERIFVDEGDEVVAGKTQLFQVDPLKLQKAVEVRRQELAVAKCGLREKEANLERVEADLAKAEIDVRRYEKLYEKEAIPVDVLEQQQSRYKQTKALHKHALSLIDLGMEQVRQAAAAVDIAEKDLSDASVFAPISGVVSMRFFEEGEFGDSGKPVLRVEDPRVLEVSAFLPAQYYPRVTSGKTKVRITVYGADAGVHPISYKSPTVHPKLRTFEFKCVLNEPAEAVVAGAMADIDVLLKERGGLGVPSDALQTRNGKSVLFIVQDDAARMVDVETGLESGGWTEIASGSIDPGAPVVTMGQYLLEDGTPVTVREEGA